MSTPKTKKLTPKTKKLKINDNEYTFMMCINKSSDLFTDLTGISDISTVEQFNDFIKLKMAQMKTLKIKQIKRGKQIISPESVGAVVLQTYIIDKINTICDKLGRLNDPLIKKRLEFFTSNSFLDAFNEPLPERVCKSTSIKDTSYANYYNRLFNVSFNDWRDQKFSKISNQTQCMRALHPNSKETVNSLNAKGDLICYLCNRKLFIGNGQSTMECEHILPILPALSHFWLVKSAKHNNADLDKLKHEYRWSHRCCNQIKSNFSFIKFNSEKYEYIANDVIINKVLTEIQNSDKKYDCSAIKKAFAGSLQNIRTTLQPLLNIINANLNTATDRDVYNLLTKYKILAALSNDDFNALILGDGTNYITSEITRHEKKQNAIKAFNDANKESKNRLIARAKQDILDRELRLANRLANRTSTFKGGTTPVNSKPTINYINEIYDKLYDAIQYLDDKLENIEHFEKFNKIINEQTIPIHELNDEFNKLFITQTYTIYGDTVCTMFKDVPNLTDAQRRQGWENGTIVTTSPNNWFNSMSVLPKDLSSMSNEQRIKAKNTGLFPPCTLKTYAPSSRSNSIIKTKKRKMSSSI